MDPFDDIFATAATHARAGGKFQPKIKHRPRKQTSASASSTVPSDTKERTGGVQISELAPSTLPGTKEDKLGTVPMNSFNNEASAQPSDIGKSATQVDSVQFGVDPFDDIFSESATNSTQAGLKFQPKMKLQPRKGASRGVAAALPNTIERPVTLPVVDSVQSVQSVDTGNSTLSKCIDSSLATPEILASRELTVNDPCSNVSASDNTKSLEVGNPSQSQATDAPQSEVSVPHTSEVWHSSSGKAVDENVDLFSGMEYLDDFIAQTTGGKGSEASKSQREVDMHVQHGNKFLMSYCVNNDLEGPISPAEIANCSEEDFSAPAHVLDYSSARFSDSIAIAPTPEVQGDKEPTNVPEAIQSDGTILGDMHSEDVPKVLGKDGKSRMEEAFTEPNHHRKNKKSSTASEAVEKGKSPMQLRKRLRQFADETVDETDEVNNSTCEIPRTSNGDDGKDNDDEFRVDSTSRKKKAPRKVKEPVPGNGKPGRKRKSAKDASNESTKEPPKKFSHSTRRSKRRVDKALLDTPEDEIDPKRLPIKDLILLAEHRERVAEIKDAAKLKTPQTNQSADDSFHEDASYNEEDTFVSEQGHCSDDDQASYRVQPSSSYVNYQTYMEKTPSRRWSKQETELFYEAVRQFGAVFSLIQQLFPGRTRRQVKLKFEKEERQHPLRLSEAVTNRAKDYSHFESVIERLQQAAAAQAKQESDGNESIAVTGEEDMAEQADDAKEEATRSEWDNEAVEDQEVEVAEVQNCPLKFDESDDDPDRWSRYNF